jgi:hypothetical protein
MVLLKKVYSPDMARSVTCIISTHAGGENFQSGDPDFRISRSDSSLLSCMQTICDSPAWFRPALERVVVIANNFIGGS